MSAHEIFCAPLTFTVEKNGTLEDRSDAFEDYGQYVSFYNELRRGAFSRTSMLNLEAHLAHFTFLAERGAKDVVHFTISSGLSPTKEVARQAADTVGAKFPGFRVLVVDPLTATVGQGALVKIALECREKNMSAEETVAYVNTLVPHIQHFIMADDLRYLRRGGRISGASATLGSLLNIKPIISFDSAGKLFVLNKVRGTKKAISFIKEKMEKEGPDEHNLVYIVHADNLSAAEELAGYVRKRFSIEPNVSIMGPIIGSHVGPGAVALGYLSKSERNAF